MWQHISQHKGLRCGVTVLLLTTCADNIVALEKWCKRKYEGMGGQLDDFFKEVTSC